MSRKHSLPWVKNPKPMALRMVPPSGQRPAEIFIDGMIGDSLWDDSMTGSREYDEALSAIPEGQPFCVYVNSEGGSVKDGLGIYASTRRRRTSATMVITGYALSIASVFPLAAGKVVIPDPSIWMIHEPWSITMGTAEDHRDAAAMLDVHGITLAQTYAKALSKSEDEMRALMEEETWFTGSQAREFGFGVAPEEGDQVPTEDPELTPLEPSALRRFPAWMHERMGVRSSKRVFSFPRSGQAAGPIADNQKPPTAKRVGAEPQKDEMKREAIIALLAQHGGKVEDGATDEVLVTELNRVITAQKQPAKATEPEAPALDILAQFNALKGQLDAMAAMRQLDQTKLVEAEVDKCINERRIPADQRKTWVENCTRNSDVLNSLKALPPRPFPPEPVIEIVAEDPKHAIQGIEALDKPVLNLVRSGDMKSAAENARRISGIYAANTDRIRQTVMAGSTNTISSDLKRVLLLNDSLRAFKRRLLMANAFSTVYSNVPLQGTDEVVVPYYPLYSTASTDFVAGTGYTTFGNTNDSSKKITVNKRKYQSFSYSSVTLQSQPFFNVSQHLALFAEQLGVDVIADILSVVTAANFATVFKTETAAAFDSNDVADARIAGNTADWPSMGRSMILDTAYEGALTKDPDVKQALNSGSDQALREGITGRLFGYDIYENPRIPSNAENLKGMILFKSAILCATAPVAPAPGVRQQLVAYSLAIDPDTGIGFNYRHFGNAVTDEDQEVIEARYGYVTGVTTALQRIVSP